MRITTNMGMVIIAVMDTGNITTHLNTMDPAVAKDVMVDMADTRDMRGAKLTGIRSTKLPKEGYSFC